MKQDYDLLELVQAEVMKLRKTVNDRYHSNKNFFTKLLTIKL